MMTFQQILAAALADFDEHGYDSAERLENWLRQLKVAAERELINPQVMQQRLVEALGATYRRLVDQHQIMRPQHQVGRVAKFVPDMLKPELRKILARKVVASAELIKLNRQGTVSEVLRRFTGYVTSLPADGAPDPVELKERRTALRGRLRELPFEERRVIIDQGHKLTAALSETIAVDGRAIAAKWHSNWRQLGYRYREDHKERDDRVYVLKAGWAYQQGLVTAGDGFIEDMTRPAEEVFCRCHYQWLFGLRSLPIQFLTPKGLALQAEVRQKLKKP